ncbi:S-layer homology domain-containing protein [Oscillospiraceae bacterium CM]|nr:S-layer homology domain-containing protein [Oscillospiraceae bacterium CM]
MVCQLAKVIPQYSYRIGIFFCPICLFANDTFQEIPECGGHITFVYSQHNRRLRGLCHNDTELLPRIDSVTIFRWFIDQMNVIIFKGFKQRKNVLQMGDKLLRCVVWIDRPVHVKGLGDDVNLSRHSSLTEYGNTTTTITAPIVTLEKLNFSNGDMGITFDKFSKYAYSSYPDFYKILGCNFTNFTQIAIYEPGYTIDGYETVPGSTTEIRNNIISRTTDAPNGSGVHLINQSENLYFSNNTLSGDYNYGITLNGQNIYTTDNSISVNSQYNEFAFEINNTKNLECADNVISNSGVVADGSGTSGLILYFNDTEGSSSKEIYQNHIHGFNSGAILIGNEISEIYDVTIGGTASNANDFSDNEFGLTSSLSNFNSSPTNASYNIWGRADDLLPGYIKGSHYSADYQPVTYLPTASMTLSDDATLSGLSASGITLSPVFDSATTGYTANVSNSTSSTTVSVVTSDDSATVTINGTAGSSKAVALNVGSNTITVQVTAEDDTTTTYTIDISRAVSDGGGENGGGGGTPTDTGTKVTVTTTDGQVSVTGTLTQTNGGTQVVIKNDDFNKVNTADKPVAVNAHLATVAFDKKAMDTIGTAAGSGDVILTVRQVPATELSAAQKALVGSRPVYDFTVTGGGKTISNFNGGHATVSIPYTLGTGEHPHAIVIWYLSDSGKLVGMRGHYDAATKSVVFRTPHFSSFVVGYNPIGFQDVPAGAWYESAVTFLAARDITTGTGDGNFSPDAALTRGQFIVMLMRAYGIEPDANPVDNFADAGNTYYTNFIATAKRLGITNGIGNNLFAPDREITRQEMFTLLYNALTVIGEPPEGNAGKELSDFSDADRVASWAKNAMTLLIETGSISGSSGKLFPTESTTRAEMAQVLYNLLIK